jgi:hypothetical protein
MSRVRWANAGAVLSGGTGLGVTEAGMNRVRDVGMKVDVRVRGLWWAVIRDATDSCEKYQKSLTRCRLS